MLAGNECRRDAAESRERFDRQSGGDADRFAHGPQDQPHLERHDAVADDRQHREDDQSATIAAEQVEHDVLDVENEPDDARRLELSSGHRRRCDARSGRGNRRCVAGR